MPRPVGTASYRALLCLPGAASAFASAALIRLSYATVTLSFFLVVQDATGSFAIAGAALSAFALPSLIAPYKSRLIDRVGVRPGLTALGVGYASALAAVAGCGVGEVASPLPYVVLAVLAGVLTPPVGPVMRGRWAALTQSDADRNRAYSLDAVAEEGLFAAGPLLVGAVVLIAAPVPALLLTAALALVGCVALGRSGLAHAGPVLAQVRTVSPTAGRLLGSLRVPGIRWLALAMLGFGFALAPLEIAVIARATEAGTAASAGVLLALLSVGSVAGGLMWGRLHLERRRSSQLLALLALVGAGTAAAGSAPTLPLLAVVLAVTGAGIAPVFVVAYVIADRLVDDSIRTETSTWIATASNVGASLGLAAAGLLVEHVSAGAAFVAGGMLLIATLPVLIILRERSGLAETPIATTLDAGNGTARPSP